jgi:hypothetical protein
MAEQAIILIPDISGFTGFTSAMEIHHAAHIITELLDLIVASNETAFTLAEIEGDTVLFYRKGKPLRIRQPRTPPLDIGGRDSRPRRRRRGP